MCVSAPSSIRPMRKVKLTLHSALTDSIAYFVQPADEVVLEGLGDGQGILTDEQWREVLRFKNLLSETGEVEVLTAGEHLRRRLASTYKS